MATTIDLSADSCLLGVIPVNELDCFVPLPPAFGPGVTCLAVCSPKIAGCLGGVQKKVWALYIFGTLSEEKNGSY